MAITKKQFRKSYRLILDWDDLPSSLLQLVFACFLTLSLGSCLAAVRHPLFFICWWLSRVSSLASSSPYITYDAWEITFCLSSDLDPCLLRKSKEAHLLLDFLKAVLSLLLKNWNVVDVQYYISYRWTITVIHNFFKFTVFYTYKFYISLKNFKFKF